MHPYQPTADVTRHWRLFLTVAIGLAVWCGVDVHRRSDIDPDRPWKHRTDFTVYTEAGAAFFDGRDPYQVTNVRGWTYLYPPLFAICVAPLYDLPPEWQASVWFAFSAALCFGCYFECRRLWSAALQEWQAHSKTIVRVPRWLFLPAVVAAVLPALNCLQRGQVESVKLYFLLLGFRWIVLGTTWRSWLLGGIALGLPVAIKLTPLLPVACLVLALFTVACVKRSDSSEWLRLGWSTGGVWAGLLLFLLVIPAACVGWNDNLRHLTTWYQTVIVKADDVHGKGFGAHVASMRNQSLGNAVYRIGNVLSHQFAGGPHDLAIEEYAPEPRPTMPMDSPIFATCMSVARLGVLLMLAMACVQLAGQPSVLALGFAFGLACYATLIVCPVARGHYFVMLLPGLLFAPLWLWLRGSRLTAWCVAILPAGLCVAHYVAVEVMGRCGVLGLGSTVAYLALCFALTPHGQWLEQALQFVMAPARPGLHRLDARLAPVWRLGNRLLQIAITGRLSAGRSAVPTLADRDECVSRAA